MWFDYFEFCVLGYDADGGGVGAATYTVLPAASVSIKAEPFLRGDKPVIELIDGTRIFAPSENSYHIDIEIDWEELDPAAYDKLITWVKNAYANMSAATYTFYPQANTGRTSYDTNYAGVSVIPEFTDDLIQMVYKGKVRKREAKLVLKGTAPILAASLPAWILANKTTL